ncbi:MAG: oligosaccharide flippase family protein [bacterium]|nr:oligosaccharide flippase family protein [bacterium]
MFIVNFVKEKFDYLSRNLFVRNVATLQIGSFGGTLVQAVFGIFIARLLQPELFGVYSLAIGLAALAGLLLGAGMQDAVATLVSSAYARNDKEELREVLAFLLKITFYAGLSTLLVFFFIPSVADYFYGNTMIGWYAGIVLLGVFLSTSFNAVVQLSLQVSGRIKTLAWLVFGDQFLRSGLALFFVFLGFGVFGGVSGHFVGAAAIFIFSVLVWKKLVTIYEIFPSLGDLLNYVRRVSVKKYFSFSFWIAVDRNMGNLYMVLPVVLTGIYVSAGEVSFFKLAFGYINLALSLLGPISILLNMEFPKIQVDDPKKLRDNFIRVSKFGLFISVILTLGAIVVSPWAFRILYGESFMPSVSYVFGLVAYGALYGIGVGLGPMWRAINKVKVSIIINLVILVAGIPAGLWLVKSYGLWGSVVMVTMWFTVSHLVSFAYLFKKLKKLNG